MLTVENERTGVVLADRCRLAASPISRLVGLLNRSSLPIGEGLLIRPCSSVHNFFMRFPIDVAFLDGEGRVLKTYEPLRVWRATTIVRGAKQALELPADALATSGTRIGDVLRFDVRVEG